MIHSSSLNTHTKHVQSERVPEGRIHTPYILYNNIHTVIFIYILILNIIASFTPSISGGSLPVPWELSRSYPHRRVTPRTNKATVFDILDKIYRIHVSDGTLPESGGHNPNNRH